MPNIQDENVLISRAFLEKCLEKFWRRKLGCNISPDRIEAFHRVGRTNDTVIVTFSRRKDCQRTSGVLKGSEETYYGGL